MMRKTSKSLIWAKLCQLPVADALTELSSTEASELPGGQSRRLRLRNTAAMLQPSMSANRR